MESQDFRPDLWKTGNKNVPRGHWYTSCSKLVKQHKIIELEFCALYILRHGNASRYLRINKSMNMVDILDILSLEPMLINLNNIYTNVFHKLKIRCGQEQARVPTRYVPGRCLVHRDPVRIVVQVRNMDYLAVARPCPIPGLWLANNTQSTVHWKHGTCTSTSNCCRDNTISLTQRLISGDNAIIQRSMARTWAETLCNTGTD